jgi:hypothetical protein
MLWRIQAFLGLFNNGLFATAKRSVHRLIECNHRKQYSSRSAGAGIFVSQRMVCACLVLLFLYNAVLMEVYTQGSITLPKAALDKAGSAEEDTDHHMVNSIDSNIEDDLQVTGTVPIATPDANFPIHTHTHTHTQHSPACPS